jgi:hypothetical protein
MIAALGAALLLAPAHVNGFYMSSARRSLAEEPVSGTSTVILGRRVGWVLPDCPDDVGQD